MYLQINKCKVPKKRLHRYILKCDGIVRTALLWPFLVCPAMSPAVLPVESQPIDLISSSPFDVVRVSCGVKVVFLPRVETF
jgi:hypothetical protein